MCLLSNNKASLNTGTSTEQIPPAHFKEAVDVPNTSTTSPKISHEDFPRCPMGSILPSSRLALSFAFDLADDTVINTDSQIHNNAVKQAARIMAEQSNVQVEGTAFSDPALPFQGRATTGTDLTLEKVHHARFDPTFHVANGGPAVRYEFFYDLDARRVFFRVVTSFGEPNETIDGVFAVRIGLTALEILEGNTPHPTVFPKHKPLQIGISNHLRLFYYVFGALFTMILVKAYFAILGFLGVETKKASENEEEMTVNSIFSLKRFTQTPQANNPGFVNIFRNDNGNAKQSFRQFLRVLEDWRRDMKLKNFFYLINFSPLVAAGMTQTVSDLASVETRYAKAMGPATPPPPPPVFEVNNSLYADTIFVNNYGNHKHSFRARPTGYIWDWLHFPNHCHGAGCITINGTFLCFFRGLKSSVEATTIHKVIQDIEPVALMPCNAEWFPTMGLWEPSSPPKKEEN